MTAASPWSTQVRIDNKTETPVQIWLARSATEPSPDDAIEYTIPARSATGITSGWLNEPRATLLVRTAADEAKLIRAPHKARIIITTSQQGLSIDSVDMEPIEDEWLPDRFNMVQLVPLSSGDEDSVAAALSRIDFVLQYGEDEEPREQTFGRGDEA